MRTPVAHEMSQAAAGMSRGHLWGAALEQSGPTARLANVHMLTRDVDSCPRHDAGTCWTQLFIISCSLFIVTSQFTLSSVGLLFETELPASQHSELEATGEHLGSVHRPQELQ